MRSSGLLNHARSLLLALPFLLPAVNFAAADTPVVAPDATSFTLDNGLQVVVIPGHGAPVVTQMIWYKAGAADEVPGKSGIAHFLEHLMFKGTKTHAAGEFSAKVAEIGGNENAFTSSDYTAYFQTVAKENLPTVMSFEADRMENLVLTDEVVLPERDVILEERRSRTDNDPSAQLNEAMGAALYQNHHYGIPVIGWEHEMQGLTREDAVAWYNRYYTPNNAILVIAGDVTVDEVKKLAADTFAKVPRRADPGERHRAQEPPPLAARAVTMADARVAQPTVQREYLAPSYGSGPEKEALALDVLSDILGGGTTSRLYKTLVVEKGVAASSGAWYDGTAIDPTSFGVYAVPRGDISLEKLAGEIDAVIAKIKDEGISEDELTRAKRHVLADAIYTQDRVSSLARIFGAALAIGETVEDVQQWPSRIQNVTAADVQDVAKKYLDLKRSVTGYLTSAPGEGRT
jgi:zinc protease